MSEKKQYLIDAEELSLINALLRNDGHHETDVEELPPGARMLTREWFLRLCDISQADQGSLVSFNKAIAYVADQVFGEEDDK